MVEEQKKIEELKQTYLSWKVHDDDVRYDGFPEGATQKAVEAARNLFANGASIEFIAKSLKMSECEIRELTKDIVPEMELAQLNNC